MMVRCVECKHLASVPGHPEIFKCKIDKVLLLWEEVDVDIPCDDFKPIGSVARVENKKYNLEVEK